MVETHPSRDKYIKEMLGQIILIATFAVSSLTTLTTLYIIFGLRLNDDNGLIQIREISESSSQLLVNQNIGADIFQPLEEIYFEQINSPFIDVSNRNLLTPKESSASISMNGGDITIHAKEFTTGSSEQIDFRLPATLSSLNVLHGIVNIRLIRSPSSNLPGRSSPILEIISGTDLHLSGNLGVRSHSSRAVLSSQRSIDLVSKDGSIILNAAHGINLPDLARDHTQKESNYIMDQYDEVSVWQKNSGKIQLCIRQQNGQIYQATDSC